MAEAFVNVTEGSGKKLHAFDKTIGANTVLDEIVVEGEQYLASYTITTSGVGGVSIATANSHVLQIMAGSSLKVRVRRIEIHQATVATAAVLGVFSLFRLSTAGTGGTALTANPLDPADAAAGATGMKLPTVKGTEGVELATAVPYLMQTVTASAQLNQPIVRWDFDTIHTKPLVIAAGTANGVAVKNVTAVAAGQVVVVAWITESNF